MLTERRAAVRYPIILDARYRTLSKKSTECGIGRTVDISSGGLLIASVHNVIVGVRLEVAVEWPALLDGTTELLFVANGEVVRVWESSFALKLSRYQFHTTRRKVRSAAAGVGYSGATGTKTPAGSDVPTAIARFRVPEPST